MHTFDTLEIGNEFALGSHEVNEQEIISFAKQWDPQPFHLDEKLAQASQFGGLIASGWHTGAIFMRLFVDGLLKDSTSMGSPGIDELRWLVPVRPGDVLSGGVTVVDLVPSKSKPDRGVAYLRCELTNSSAAVVLRMTARVMFARN